MFSIFSLASSVLVFFVLATSFSSFVSASTDWYKVVSNPIVNYFTGQPFVNSPFNYPLSGFVDYQDKTARAGFGIGLHQDPAPTDNAIAYDNGPAYYNFIGNLPSPVAYPYFARLATVGTGDRVYGFFQTQSDPNTLFAYYSDVADYYGGPIYGFNSWNTSSPVLIYNDEFDQIEQISVTTLNDGTIYIAIENAVDGAVHLISTNDFVTFTDEGQFIPANSAQPITAYDGTSVFAGKNPADPAGPEILWFHWIDAATGVPYISYTSQAQPQVLNVPFIEIGNVTLKTQLGVTAAVSVDGSTAMLLRVGSTQGSAQTLTIYYSLFNTKTMTVIQDETQLVGLDGTIPQIGAAGNGAMPTIISSRYAGDAIKGKPVVVAWANVGDRNIYSLAGSPY